MAGLDAFETLAEFAIALAGFASVVVVLRRGEDRFHPADHFRVFNALVPSLIVGFLAMLPIGLAQLGLAPAAIWITAGWVYVVVVSAVGTRTVRWQWRLPPEAKEVISSRVGAVNAGLMVVCVVAVLVDTTTPLLAPRNGGPYFFGLLVLLGVSANAFVRMVFIRPRA